MARYFECPIQCFSAAFDVLIKILESYRPQIPSVSRATGRLRNEIRGGRDSRCVRDWVERGWECGRGFREGVHED